MKYFYYIRISIYTILLIIILNVIQPLEKTVIDSRVQPFYNKYMKVLNTYCNEDQYFHPAFKIEIKKLSEPVIGLCISLPNKFTIYLDETFWNEENDVDKLILVAHELTHCMLDQEHIDKYGHFMAPSFYPIPLERLYSQMIDLFKEKCNEK